MCTGALQFSRIKLLNQKHVCFSQAYYLAEDPLLEDLCEIGGVEAERNAEEISDKEKRQMLMKLSKVPATEKFLRNEQALGKFVESQYRGMGNSPHTLTLDGIHRTGSMLSINQQTSKLSTRQSNIAASRISARQSNMSTRPSNMGRHSSNMNSRMSNTSMNRNRISAYDLGFYQFI